MDRVTEIIVTVLLTVPYIILILGLLSKIL